MGAIGWLACFLGSIDFSVYFLKSDCNQQSTHTFQLLVKQLTYKICIFV